MIGVAFLDVAIGLILLFLLASLLVTAASEVVERFRKTRARELEKGLRDLLGRGDFLADFYRHPQIFSLFSGEAPPPTASGGEAATLGRRHPSYIPARNFAVALLDLAVAGPVTSASGAAASTVMTVQAIEAGLTRIPDPTLQRAIRNALDMAEGRLEDAVRNLERWYDGAMDRVSGRFKRHTQAMSFLLGLMVAAALNIDAVEVAKRLSSDQALREAAVSAAEARVAVGGPGATSTFQAARQDIQSIGYPIGWPAPQCSVRPSQSQTTTSADEVRPCSENPVGTFLLMVLGWAITALAATLGAPFWFDLLNKFMVIRATVKPREKSPEEGSEDRRPRPTTPVVAAAPAPDAAAPGPSLPA